MSQGSASVETAIERPIHGRYRVDAELARGAMGAVYRVFDEVAHKPLALKRSLSQERRFVGMFEREYHALLGLRHPRIIEVYDYGVDELGAYYTMELLSGRDLGELAPLDYREACRCLRDVASSLGLLHARRLLHRDLSPRNVRVGDDGRCKLLDFGGLSSFGVPELVVGTPPFIPPEALHRLPLDQRADLFALGAVAYSLLTGKYAYPARSLAALPEVWRQAPARPSEVLAQLNMPRLPAIPAELDELVMSLITIDPLGRPASAAEVIDRLTRIGALPVDTDAGAAARSYLVGVQSVGRRRELEKLRERLERAIAGRGARVLLESRAGLGSTRLILDLAVEAQLAGALPLVIDAAVGGESFGAVHALIDKLLTSAHDDAIAAAQEHATWLARLSPVLARELGVAPDTTDLSTTPSELRRRFIAAVSGWLSKLCARRALFIAVDNAHALDDASGALLASLATDAGKSAMLLLVCVKTEQREAAPASLRTLLRDGDRIELRALGSADVAELVRLWFGDVKHATRLADALHRASGGNVRACTELAEHLVRTGVVRDIEGTWALPFELNESELPAGVHALQSARVASLPEPERRVLEALALHRRPLPLALCVDVAKTESDADAYAVLENLVRENALQSAGGAYALSYEALREAVLAQLAPEQKRALHLRMGALFAGARNQSTSSQLDAGWHLLSGGERERGAALLAEAGLALGYSNDDLASAIPALRAALEVYRGEAHSDYDRLRLLAPLGLASIFADRRLGSEFGDEMIATAERVLGLRLQRRLARYLGARLALFVSLGCAVVRFALHRQGGIAGFRSMIVRCLAAVTTLCATAGACLDAARARQIAQRFAPLTGLGSDTGAAYAYRFNCLLATAPTERVSEMIAEARAVLTRLDDPRPIRELPQKERDALRAGVLQLLGVLELFCADSQTLAIAQRLEQSGMIQDRATADQLRLSYHAVRGEAKLADAYRNAVELHAVQGGTLWLFDVWSPCFFILVYTSTLDMIGLKNVAEQLQRLSREVPSLRNDAIMVNAEYHHLKGDHETAFALSQPVLDATVDRGFMGRSNAMATYCRGLNRLGRHAEAKAILEPLIAGVSEADRRVAMFYVNSYRECALAYAGLSEFSAAFALLDENLARYASSAHPLILGNLHSTAASVAVAAGDAARALTHASEMARWFRRTENPVLIAQCEKLMRRVRALPGVLPAHDELAALSPANDVQSGDLRSALSRLPQLQTGDERAQYALDLVLSHLRARSGYLFVPRNGAPRLLAPLHGEEPPQALIERVSRDLGLSQAQDEGGEATVAARVHAGTPVSTQVSYLTHALTHAARVVAVVAVRVPSGNAVRRPRAEFAEAVGSALLSALDPGPVSSSELNAPCHPPVPERRDPD